jgi:hypothetical protein
LRVSVLKFFFPALQVKGGHYRCGKDGKILDIISAGAMDLFHIQPAVFMELIFPNSTSLSTMSRLLHPFFH